MRLKLRQTGVALLVQIIVQNLAWIPPNQFHWIPAGHWCKWLLYASSILLGCCVGIRIYFKFYERNEQIKDVINRMGGHIGN